MNPRLIKSSVLTWNSIGLIFLLLVQKSNTVDIHTTPQEFCYSDLKCGPVSEKWSGICHNGTRQSPLNLKPSHRQLPEFYSIPNRHLKSDFFFIQNNGHTININFGNIYGHGLFPGYGLSTTKYKLENAHFHWGKTNDVGSEHLIDGESYSMEIHLVHYNHKFTSVSEAISSGNHHAVAVVAILLQASELVKSNLALTPIINNLNKIHDKHSYWEKIDEPLDFSYLIPPRNEWMYHYKGSLTTPGCNENVNWYVFEKPILISTFDVESFRKVNDGNGGSILENYRPVQEQMGRRVRLVLLE